METNLLKLFRNHATDRRGAMLPLVAVTIIILFVAAAIAVDIARVHVTRSELRTATDAAARAGVEALGRLQSQDAAIAAAIAVAEQNEVAGDGLLLEARNIVFGSSAQVNGSGPFEFTAGAEPINSIQVIGARTEDSLGGPVPMFFGRMFGVDNFEPEQEAVATRIDRDIALVLDVSGSMSREGRFAALSNAIQVFIQEMEDSPQEERLSLTVYSDNANKLVAMTPDLQAIQSAFNTQRPLAFTAIGRGMQTGLDSILNDPGTRPFALKSIIVMTDGNHNRGIPPDVVARDCADADVTVHTITFSNGANQVLMQTVAETAGGLHLHAENNQELVDAFRDIARQLRVLLTK